MKKALYILFAFYFLSLAVVTCGDNADCNEMTHELTSQSTGDHEDEMCTPFCVCSCCATLFVVSSFHPLHKQIAVIQSVYTIHPESETASAIIPVWQPPKLG